MNTCQTKCDNFSFLTEYPSWGHTNQDGQITASQGDIIINMPKLAEPIDGTGMVKGLRSGSVYFSAPDLHDFYKKYGNHVSHEAEDFMIPFMQAKYFHGGGKSKRLVIVQTLKSWRELFREINTQSTHPAIHAWIDAIDIHIAGRNFLRYALLFQNSERFKIRWSCYYWLEFYCVNKLPKLAKELTSHIARISDPLHSPSLKNLAEGVIEFAFLEKREGVVGFATLEANILLGGGILLGFGDEPDMWRSAAGDDYEWYSLGSSIRNSSGSYKADYVLEDNVHRGDLFCFFPDRNKAIVDVLGGRHERS